MEGAALPAASADGRARRHALPAQHPQAPGDLLQGPQPLALPARHPARRRPRPRRERGDHAQEEGQEQGGGTEHRRVQEDV